MQQDQQSQLNALHRVQWFVDTNKDALKVASVSPAKVEFDAILGTLVEHEAGQHSAEVNATSLTRDKDALRDELRLQHMQPVAIIARIKLADTPAIVSLRLPPTRTRDGDLVAAGLGMVHAATPYKQVFLDAMLPADFLERLKAATLKLREALTQRDGARIKLRRATAGVVEELIKARSLVRLLHSFVVQDLKDEPSLLAAWVMAKRPTLKPGIPRGTVSSQDATVATDAAEAA